MSTIEQQRFIMALNGEMIGSVTPTALTNDVLDPLKDVLKRDLNILFENTKPTIDAGRRATGAVTHVAATPAASLPAPVHHSRPMTSDSSVSHPAVHRPLHTAGVHHSRPMTSDSSVSHPAVHRPLHTAGVHHPPPATSGGARPAPSASKQSDSTSNPVLEVKRILHLQENPYPFPPTLLLQALQNLSLQPRVHRQPLTRFFNVLMLSAGPWWSEKRWQERIW